MSNGDTRIRLLGRFAVENGGHDLELERPAARLIAFLAVMGRRVRRERIAGELWGDRSEEAAAAGLRCALWKVRRRRDDLFDVHGDLIGIAPQWPVDYREALEIGREMALGGAANLEALSMFDQDLLPDWYEPWLAPAQDAFRETRIHALESIARSHLDAGRHWPAIEACRAALGAEPLRQSAHLLLVEIYRSEGNDALALRHLSEYQSFVRTELGV